MCSSEEHCVVPILTEERFGVLCEMGLTTNMQLINLTKDIITIESRIVFQISDVLFLFIIDKRYPILIRHFGASNFVAL